MELQFIDWEIEKEGMEDFNGYVYRFQLNQITGRKGHLVTAINLISCDNIKDIIAKIGELVIYEGSKSNIIFVKNSSLASYWKRY